MVRPRKPFGIFSPFDITQYALKTSNFCLYVNYSQHCKSRFRTDIGPLCVDYLLPDSKDNVPQMWTAASGDGKVLSTVLDYDTYQTQLPQLGIHYW
jgi:hypothetical protein